MKNSRLIIFPAGLFFLLLSLNLVAQIPSSVFFDSKPTTESPLDCADQFAGDVSFSNFVGQSNDFVPDTIYLCYDDQFDVNVTGQDLTGDPDPSSTPGVGYAFYSCQPTVSGPDLATLILDGCLIPDPSPTSAFYVSTASTTSGFQTFKNTGALQGSFNAGNPLLLWFAPVTFDELVGSEAWWEDNPSGPCVSANINDAFPVVYLNKLDSSNVQNSFQGFGCEGRFRVQGGLPEYDGASHYDIDISLATDPSVKGFLFGDSYAHGNLVRFQVNQGGTYIVRINDGKSCELVFTINMPGCPSIGLGLPDTIVSQGDNVCIPVTVADFVNIQALQWVLKWDSLVMHFDKIMDTGVLPNLNVNNAFNLVNAGELTFAWFDIGGVTLQDDDVIFEICFDAYGPLGSVTSIFIGPETNGLVIQDINGVKYGLNADSGEGSLKILNPNAMIATINPTNPSCAGFSNGVLDVSVTGGVFPVELTYTHNSGTPTNMITLPNANVVPISGLPAGTYDLQFVDATGAVLDTSAVLIDPELLGASVMANTTPLCNGENGNLCATVSLDGVIVSNTTDYIFSWDNGESTSCIDVIFNGTVYSVTVTDQNGCSTEASDSPTQPSSVSISNSSITHPVCQGSTSLGEITIEPSGGIPINILEYSFVWADATSIVDTASSQTRSGLGEGTYTVTISDANGCTFEESFTLAYEKEIQVATTITDISCFGEDDGTIEAVAGFVGGSEALPYAFVWSPTSGVVTNPTQQSELVSGLSQNTYSVIVTDGDGCTAEATDLVVNEPDSLFVQLDQLVHESCTGMGGDGSIQVSSMGGTGAGYTYLWNTTPAEMTPDISGLSPGSYSVIATDGSGCTAQATYTINPPTLPTIDGFTKVDVNCPTDTDGSMTVEFTPGNGTSHVFSWDNLGSTQTITGLSVDSFCVTITDEYGCEATDCEAILALGGFYLEDTVLTNPQCPGMDNGNIIVSVAGGIQPYDIIWDGQTGAQLSNVPAGTYGVTISDQGQCPAFETTFTLEDPPAIVPVMTLNEGVSCFSGSVCDGQATVAAGYSDGNTGVFNFIWNNTESCSNSQSCTANLLCLGENIVQITDGNCIVSDTIVMVPPDSINIAFDVTDVRCFGESNGSITATATGGSGTGYTYVWPFDGGQTGQTISGLLAGNHSVSVTDSDNCSWLETVVIDEPQLLEVLLDGGKTFDVFCHGDTTGQITVQPIGGNAGTGYTYLWSPDVSVDNVAANLSSGVYAVTVTDGMGCSASLIDTVSEPAAMFASLNPVESPECFGYQTVISIDTVYGGAGGPYSFSVDFSPPQSILLEYQVFADDHHVVVFDAFDCPYEIDITVTEPDEIFVSLPEVVELDLGDSLRLDPLISSYLPLDTFFWYPDTFLNTALDLKPMVSGLSSDLLYTLTVIDTNGCEATGQTLIEIDRNRNVYIPNVFSPNSDGFNNKFGPLVGDGVAQVNFMHIYDRWGNLVYAAEDFFPNENSSERWDGMYRGRLSNVGVYVYLIEVQFIDGITLLYRGDVTLIR